MKYTFAQGYRSKDVDDFKSGSNPANASLIKRFNQHSTMVLKSCDKKPAPATAAAANTAESGGGVERLAKDVTVNGVHSVTSTPQQNSTPSTPADVVTSNHEVTDKHVRNAICRTFVTCQPCYNAVSMLIATANLLVFVCYVLVLFGWLHGVVVMMEINKLSQ